MELGSQSLVSPHAPRRDPHCRLRANRESQLPFDQVGNAATRSGGPTRESKHSHGPVVIFHFVRRFTWLVYQRLVFRVWIRDRVALCAGTAKLAASQTFLVSMRLARRPGV